MVLQWRITQQADGLIERRSDLPPPHGRQARPAGWVRLGHCVPNRSVSRRCRRMQGVVWERDDGGIGDHVGMGTVGVLGTRV